MRFRPTPPQTCAVLVLLVLVCTPLCGQSSLNLSHDLVTNGIANQDMGPNQPDLDSRPLLEAAVAYATKNGVTTLTADPGNYYFLSLHNNMTHVLINQAAN